MEYITIVFTALAVFWGLLFWFHLLDLTILRKKKPGEKGILHVNDQRWHNTGWRDPSRD